jgi:methylated-DNA-[protein]-cysteine S-methyltransferase
MQFWDTLESPLGLIAFAVDAQGALLRVFLDGRLPAERRTHRHCIKPKRQLAEYFAGRRRHFDLALAPSGTAFQLRVWQALRAIPYGVVTPYAAIARAVGKPGAARAVGQANGANPLPIVIPCHRVIASDRSLGGFSAGLDRKRALLAIEGITLPAVP